MLRERGGARKRRKEQGLTVVAARERVARQPFVRDHRQKALALGPADQALELRPSGRCIEVERHRPDEPPHGVVGSALAEPLESRPRVSEEVALKPV
jgi:hypothetical protein